MGGVESKQEAIEKYVDEEEKKKWEEIKENCKKCDEFFEFCSKSEEIIGIISAAGFGVLFMTLKSHPISEVEELIEKIFAKKVKVVDE